MFIVLNFIKKIMRFLLKHCKPHQKTKLQKGVNIIVFMQITKMITEIQLDSCSNDDIAKIHNLLTFFDKRGDELMKEFKEENEKKKRS